MRWRMTAWIVSRRPARDLDARRTKLAPDQRRALDALERTFQAHLSRPLDGEEDIVIPLMIQLARKGEGAA